MGFCAVPVYNIQFAIILMYSILLLQMVAWVMMVWHRDDDDDHESMVYITRSLE